MHSKGKPFAPDVDFLPLAKRTVGMSGADLANVINEAALLTAREHGTVITNAALEESVDRVVGGPARRGKVISEKEKKITAYHEGGHALAAWAMPGLEPVYKVTILPRGRTGGHALVVPEDDKSLMTRSEMIARLVMAMGGRAAEELVFAEPTTGASSDIAQATKIARAMVTEYGMSAKLGAVKYGHGDDEPFLGRTYGSGPEYSIEVGSEIDGEVRALIEAAHTEAWAVLNTYRDILDSLASALLEKETLDRRDLEVIFAEVEKRPRITTFDEFGPRLPSDRPPIKTPGELAIERGEPWPPPEQLPAAVDAPVPSARPPGTRASAATTPGRASRAPASPRSRRVGSAARRSCHRTGPAGCCRARSRRCRAGSRARTSPARAAEDAARIPRRQRVVSDRPGADRPERCPERWRAVRSPRRPTDGPGGRTAAAGRAERSAQQAPANPYWPGPDNGQQNPGPAAARNTAPGGTPNSGSEPIDPWAPPRDQRP